MPIIFSFFLLFSSMVLTGCMQGTPTDALTLSEDSLSLRQLQTRSFETQDERKLLVAAAALLQDLGFTIEESATGLGVIVGSKDRDATEAGQVVSSIAIGVLFGVSTPIDKKQKIRVSVVTQPHGKKSSLRVTFQRLVWDNQGNISKTQSVEDPKIYQDFFEKLSKSVFLEAQAI